MEYSYGKLTKTKLIVSNKEDTLMVFNLVDNDIVLAKKIKFAFGKDEYFRTFEFLENENLLIVGKKDGIVQFIDLTTERVEKEIKLPLSDDYFLGCNLDILKLSNDEKWLAVGQTWYTAYPVNLETYTTQEISVPAQPLKINYSFDDSYVAVIHGEQGGDGLIVYLQNEQGEWLEKYKHWAICDFEFSANDNCIFHFGISEKRGILKKVNLANENAIEWETYFLLKDLGDEKAWNYFGISSMICTDDDLELAINNKTFIIDTSNGQIRSTKNKDYLVNGILKNEKLKFILTEDKIAVEKI